MTRRLFLAVFLMLFAGIVRAMSILPYTPEALQKAQASGGPVALHFHADWCPTCVTQEKAFQSIRTDPQLKPMTLLVVNYDKERELKRTHKVRSQSVIIVFKGAAETARLGGETDPAKIKAGLLTAL